MLEIGFGTGLNALLTLLEANKRQLSIHYEAVEAYPVPPEEAKLLNYPQILDPSAAGNFLFLHEAEWDKTYQVTPYFSFRKKLGRFEEVNYQEIFDVIYFDAFAPSAQPELWEENVLKKMYDALKPNGVLTTYCAKGAVKRCLKGLGFTVESLKGRLVSEK